MKEAANHEATRVLFFDVRGVPHAARFLEGISAARTYGHRALLIADETDFVLVHSPPDPAYVSYLNSFGLGPEEAHVLVVSAADREFESVPGRYGNGALKDLAAGLKAEGVEECILVPYIHHQSFNELAAGLREEAGVNVAYPERAIDPAYRYSSKAEGRKLAGQLKIPLPEGILLEADAGDIARVVPQRFSPGKALIIKGIWGESGTEVTKLAAGWNRESLSEELLAWWDRDCPLIIEEAIEDHLATNVMLHVCEKSGAIEIIGITDQLIAGGIRHVGNAFPTRSAWKPEITEASINMAGVLRDEGFCGYAGVDFMETLPRDDVSSRYYFLEVNPRVNASRHPLLVMRKLNARRRPQGKPEIDAFLDLSFPVEAMSFGEVRDLLAGDVFGPQSGCGIILYSPSFASAGSLALLVLGQTEQDLKRLRDSVSGKLSSAGVLRSS